MMRLRLTMLVTLLAAVTVLLTACGADPTATPTPAPTPTPQPEATPTPMPVQVATATPTPSRPEWEVRWEETIAAAEEEGKVVVTSCGGEGRRRAMNEGWAEQFPNITLEHQPFNSRDLWPLVVREAGFGQHNFDIRIGGADTTTFSAMHTNSTHAPLDFDEWFILPEVRDPDVWLGGIDGVWLDKTKQFAWPIVLTSSAGESFWVNRNIIPESELSSVEQITDPKWKGQIIALSSEGGAAQNTMMMQMLQYGEDWLNDLLANEPVVIRDHRQQIEFLLRGQYAIATTVDTNELRDFTAEGVDLSHIAPLSEEAPSLSNACESLQLHNNMPHPNAAKVYVNWLLTKEHQQLWNEVVPTNSRRKDVECGRCKLTVTEEDLTTFRLSQDEALAEDRARFTELVQGVLIQ